MENCTANSIKPPAATLRLRLDRAALAQNWRALDRLSGKARAGAAVKANAYGLGTDFAVPVLKEAGARDFFVAHWSEVAGVLAHAAANEICVLHGAGTEEEAAYARATGVVPVINSLSQAALWLNTGGGKCHLMVDTAMNRLGISLHELGDPAIAALQVDCLMSHLASADEDSPLNDSQKTRFREVVNTIRHSEASLANSAGIALGSDYAFDMTRPGLALYGGIPRAQLDGIISQVAFPEAAIIQRRRILPGETVGYNATFQAEREMEIATISIGYADGFLRSRGPGFALQHDGTPLPVIGRVSMDMIIADCTAKPHLKEADFLSVPFHLPAISEASGFSQYELLTTIGHRFARNG